MIPLKDLNPTRRTPAVTYLFIALNVAVFLYEFSLSSEAQQDLVYRFGVVPYALTQEGHLGSWITPLSSMFMHGGWMHLIFNMWFLHIFGDNVEDTLGHVRFVVFYVICGLGAAAAQVLMDPDSTVPMVGASGAIAGILGGYVRLYPSARVLTLIPVFFFLMVRELPAVFFIFIWFGIQLISGVGALGSIGSNTGGVAFFAHIGGFLAGIALIRSFVQHNPQRGWVRPHGDLWN